MSKCSGENIGCKDKKSISRCDILFHGITDETTTSLRENLSQVVSREDDDSLIVMPHTVLAIKVTTFTSKP